MPILSRIDDIHGSLSIKCTPPALLDMWRAMFKRICRVNNYFMCIHVYGPLSLARARA